MSHSTSQPRSATSLLPTSDWIPPEDPIFGLTAAYRADTRKERVNLGVGAYRDAQGQPYVMETVREAERQLAAQNLNKEYFPILGSTEFREQAQRLLLGPLASNEELQARSVLIATPGGTGALRVGGEWIAMGGQRTVYLSTPTWPNHVGVMQRSGFEIKHYPYFDQRKGGLLFDALLEGLDTMPKGSVVLLQASCHNPTGTDLNQQQWETIGKRMLSRGLIPFFDLAYQGLGTDINTDAKAIHTFIEQGHSLLVAYSFSKNFGLYGERTGALAVVTASKESANITARQLQTMVRANYSNPPIHGLRIVTTILSNLDLRVQWSAELEEMRLRIEKMRKDLVAGLKSDKFPVDLDRIAKQRGMFSFGFLTKEQVQQLRKLHAIYLPEDGRINIAGLSQNNLDRVVTALLSVAL